MPRLAQFVLSQVITWCATVAITKSKKEKNFGIKYHFDPLPRLMQSYWRVEQVVSVATSQQKLLSVKTVKLLRKIVEKEKLAVFSVLLNNAREGKRTGKFLYKRNRCNLIILGKVSSDCRP